MMENNMLQYMIMPCIVVAILQIATQMITIIKQAETGRIRLETVVDESQLRVWNEDLLRFV